jgi:hypothetical protein
MTESVSSDSQGHEGIPQVANEILGFLCEYYNPQLESRRNTGLLSREKLLSPRRGGIVFSPIKDEAVGFMRICGLSIKEIARIFTLPTDMVFARSKNLGKRIQRDPHYADTVQDCFNNLQQRLPDATSTNFDIRDNVSLLYQNVFSTPKARVELSEDKKQIATDALRTVCEYIMQFSGEVITPEMLSGYDGDSFLVEMRRYLIIWLRSQGFKFNQIGAVLQRNQNNIGWNMARARVSGLPLNGTYRELSRLLSGQTFENPPSSCPRSTTRNTVVVYST